MTDQGHIPNWLIIHVKLSSKKTFLKWLPKKLKFLKYIYQDFWAHLKPGVSQNTSV